MFTIEKHSLQKKNKKIKKKTKIFLKLLQTHRSHAINTRNIDDAT